MAGFETYYLQQNVARTISIVRGQSRAIRSYTRRPWSESLFHAPLSDPDPNVGSCRLRNWSISVPRVADEVEFSGADILWVMARRLNGHGIRTHDFV